MCGIAGIFSLDPRQAPRADELVAMRSRLHHRGPDGVGLHVDGPVGLAHTRLAIIDVEGGAQPLANEDATVWVCFNGEIFNHVELRAELVARGHRFATRSDTEVLVHLYEDLGERFVERLNGQFAIALWDSKQQRLVLARDRLGIRPLFYAHDHRHSDAQPRIAFASEVKALFALPGVPRRLDPRGLASIFTYWSTIGDATVFEGVHAVPPGHVLTLDAQGSTCKPYWTWPFDDTADDRPLDEARAVDELRALMADAVRLQLRADVPVGAYLSGGLDSSIVTTLVAQQGDTRLRSFSLAFDDAAFDESEHQRTLAKHLRADHDTVRVGAGDIAASFERLVWHAESPMVRTAAVPMMLLADRVRASGFKVVLTGEGADEAFAGYDLFKEARVRRRALRSPGTRAVLARLYPYLPHAPGALGALAAGFFDPALGAPNDPWFAHATRMSTSRRALQWLTPAWREAADAWDAKSALRAALPPDFAQRSDLARDQCVEAQTLLPGYLLSTQGDRAAMAASVEARFPFLDHRIVELAARLPTRMKLRGLHEKRVLKLAWRNELPPSIVARTKQPYRAPDSACFFDAGKPLEWVDELLSASSLKDAGIFESNAVGKLVAKCAAGKAIGFGDNIAFVGIVSTMLVHRRFVRGDGSKVSGQGVPT
jgi:asparagine synthase (glutamine-hydrolysing)